MTVRTWGSTAASGQESTEAVLSDGAVIRVIVGRKTVSIERVTSNYVAEPMPDAGPVRVDAEGTLHVTWSGMGERSHLFTHEGREYVAVRRGGTLNIYELA